ncbi:MAG: DEAD/DEAH box helicase family protein [Syntrophales bacterium]|nr:DEAD/DEAH box helicase family protein [Syntrophales bacterium]
MNYDSLLDKYRKLIEENRSLREEIERLRAILVQSGAEWDELSQATEYNLTENNSPSKPIIVAAPTEKISLFMSLFKGREDVYAKKWRNRKGDSGYVPVCRNEWKSGLCGKPAIKCLQCRNRSYDKLDAKIIEAHLRGEIILGLYPLLKDETCWLLAIDFDGLDWQKDISTLREVCRIYDIPLAVERSQSGNGAHAWFFFETNISAVLARKFGSALITSSMVKRHEIQFRSYDRFFPSQDTMPKSGLGNLIALPLQKQARERGNSVFISEELVPYGDQWKFLAGLRKLSEADLTALVSKLCAGRELGVLRRDDEETGTPWETKRTGLSLHDCPAEMTIVKSNMVYVSKDGISQRALNKLKRLAAFKNPEFYKAQAMRMPTFNKPRVICCSDEMPDYLGLPRGCEGDIKTILSELGIQAVWSEKMNTGRPIKVEFNGALREDQQAAAEEMLKHDTGVLSATTAFGKTVIAAKLISDRKVNTLILVHRQQLLTQWTARLTEFLAIHEELPVQEIRRGRRRKKGLIGQIGAGKINPSGIIDIAVMQSLYSGGESKDGFDNYGMVIVDECHHVPAFSFEQILKRVQAKYVYGLTATPTRQDGHHPIIFMHCGPVRFRVDSKKEAEKRPFEHFVIPRFTAFRIPADQDQKEIAIQKLYSEIAGDELRNQLIAEDVIANFKKGRNSLVLTERTAHVELLAGKIKEKAPDVIVLTGGSGVKEKREALSRISDVPDDIPLILVATGRYIGEGFDEPRLDTLFLAMPISWKGTLQQYAGRLHRLSKNKNEVRIYDYVDLRVSTLEKMYNKRLNGYASIGYRAKVEGAAGESVDFIFDQNSFLPVFERDLLNAEQKIVVVSPFAVKRGVMQMLKTLRVAVDKKIEIKIITRPAGDYRNRPVQEATLALLKESGINLACKPCFHQKFAIIDRRIVWYGSINLLSFGRSEESMMRLTSISIADELMRSIE